MRLHHRTTRPAFTLTEMLVATALCLFIMVVIGQAMGQATRTFSTLRTAGELQGRNRGAINVIRRDLTADKFAGPYPGGRGGPMVGMQRMDVAGWQPSPGYFEITQIQNPLLAAGQTTIFEPYANPVPDSEGLSSTRATTHIMRFTVRLQVGPPAELYSARIDASVSTPETQAIVEALSGVNRTYPVPQAFWPVYGQTLTYNAGNAFNTGQLIYYGQWAEVGYFLLGSGDQTTGGLPLHSLRRKTRLVGPKTVDFVAHPMPPATAQLFIETNPDLALRAVPSLVNPALAVIRLQGPDDVADRNNRINVTAAAMQRVGASATNAGVVVETGADILLSDVIGFEIKAAWGANQSVPSFEQYLVNSSPAVPSMLPPALGGALNFDEPYADIPQCTLNPVLQGIRTFDTWFRNDKNDGIDWDSPTSGLNGMGFLARPASNDPLYSQSVNNVPLRVNVRSIQIKLRIWDAKAEQTRQVTIVQEIRPWS